MNKLTKIVATIGPSTDSEENIERLIKSGVNIFRFNFKHNTVDWHSERIERVTKVAKRLGCPVGKLIDLQGPEIRINMPWEEIEIMPNELILFGPESFETEEKGFSISHPDIIKHLKDGQKLVADDGAFTFYVVKKDKTTYLKSASKGILKHRKSLNIPGADFPFPVLIDRDFEGLELAARNQVNFVALSFVRSAADLRTMRREMKKFDLHAHVVAKIETKKALDHLDQIIEASDAVMVARGDLGVELPIEEVPYYQKMMIKKCMAEGKPVITATQMLQSMVENPYPTRAEVSDIANAVYDQTDCVMLSGETANGNYPLETVDIMRKTVIFHEPKTVEDLRGKFHFSIKDTEALICDAAYSLYIQYIKLHQKIGGFIVFSASGNTARLISRYRPRVPIFSFVPDRMVYESLTINFGVEPFVNTMDTDEHGQVRREEIKKAINHLVQQKRVKKGTKLIVVHGDFWGKKGGTSTLRIVEA